MKFSFAVLSSTAFLVGFTAAHPSASLFASAELDSRATSCTAGLGGSNADCQLLANDCINNKIKGTEYIWSKTSCVAAATCAGVANIYNAARCAQPSTIPSEAVQLSSLSYNIYANIVGSCAWAAGGCSITEQNYIDFYYGALSAIGSTKWPASTDFVLENYLYPILDWTDTCDELPYLNFNDWLHYSL